MKDISTRRVPAPGYVDALQAFNTSVSRLGTSWHRRALALAEGAWKTLSDSASAGLPHERATAAAALATVIAAKGWWKVGRTERERIDELVARVFEFEPEVRNEANRREAAKAWKIVMSILATLESSRGRRKMAEAYLCRAR